MSEEIRFKTIGECFLISTVHLNVLDCLSALVCYRLDFLSFLAGLVRNSTAVLWRLVKLVVTDEENLMIVGLVMILGFDTRLGLAT